MARKRKKKKKIKLIKPAIIKGFIAVLVFLGFLFAAGINFYNSKIFQISRENIKSDAFIEPEIIRQIQDRSIFNLNLDKIYRRIKQSHPEYKAVEVLKKFPNQVIIRITPRRPVAQIESSQFYLIDSDGVVTASGSSTLFQDYPLVSCGHSGFFSLGQNINHPQIKVMAKLLKALKQNRVIDKINSLDSQYDFQLSFIDFSSFPVVHFYFTDLNQNQRLQIIVRSDEIKKKISLLADIIVEKLSDKVRLLRYLDFRFERVVVGYRR